MINRLENAFESTLWGSRYLLVLGVTASAVLWIVMLYITTVDAAYLLLQAWQYGSPTLSEADRDVLRALVINRVVGVIDGYLITAALLVFTLGLYRLFVSRLDIAERSDFADRLLHIRTFDDLKGLLSRMTVLILIVKFLQQALKMQYTTTADLLYLSIGVLLIGGAMYLSHLAHAHRH